MKILQQLEALGLFVLSMLWYHHQFPHAWGVFAACFFIPDISFIAYAVSAKLGARVYNLLHHQGIMAGVIVFGLSLDQPVLIQVGLIFMAHSFFDRILGYGLKFEDSFHHTHLGWIGKVKSADPTE